MGAWWTWVEDSSFMDGFYPWPLTADSLELSEAADGVVTAIVKQAAPIVYRWAIQFGKLYLPKRSTWYEYKFEAWTDSGTRVIDFRYGRNPHTASETARLDFPIDSTRQEYTIIGKTATWTENYDQSITISCGNPVGTIYFKMLSITAIDDIFAIYPPVNWSSIPWSISVDLGFNVEPFTVVSISESVYLAAIPSCTLVYRANVYQETYRDANYYYQRSYGSYLKMNIPHITETQASMLLTAIGLGNAGGFSVSPTFPGLDRIRVYEPNECWILPNNDSDIRLYRGAFGDTSYQIATITNTH
jgi:hypothetical protein